MSNDESDDMSYQPTITVYDEDFERALRHGMELYWSDSTPKKRLDDRKNGQFTRYVNNRATGKLGEVAFSRFLRDDFGIDSQVDWRVYGDYETTDDGDLRHLFGDDGGHYKPSVEFDVKKTKPWNQWLAIRSEMFERHPENAPYVLTKLVIEDDLDVERWEDVEDVGRTWNRNEFRTRLMYHLDDHFPLDVQIVGTAYPDEFTDEFDAGDHLYDPDTGNDLGSGLRRPNVGIHVDDLVATKERWNRVVEEIVGDSPIGWDSL